MNNNDTIILEHEIIDDNKAEEFYQQYKDLLEKDPTPEEIAYRKEEYINDNIFKKTHQAKYLAKNGQYYENLAENLLNTYLPAYNWGASFDKKGKSLYIINLICSENIPNFSLVGIKTLEEFTKLVLGAGKKILVEEGLDKIISDEEFNERLVKSNEIAEKYKD